MSLIQISDLSFTYEGSWEPVFEHVSFQIDTNWKLGFVGRNGRGKTTFLKLLMEQLEYTGSITASTVFDYFPYPVAAPGRMTYEVLEDLPGSGDYEFWQLQKELGKLQMAEEALYRPFCTLSNGERTKVLLAALFLRDNHFLLIDEPTNHLDQDGRRLVSQYLNRKKGFILVSHDRAFLDGCVDHILSVNRTGMEIQKGNFSSWYENRKRQDAFEAAENERLKKDIRRLQEAARQTRTWADQAESMKIGRHPIKEETFIGTRAYIGEKSRSMQKRRKNLERRQQQAINDKQQLLKDLETAEDLKLFPLRFHGERIALFDHVLAGYGDPPQPVCSEITLELHQGDRIVLQGTNGCGKSSLLKLLSDDTAQTGFTQKPILCSGQLHVPGGLVISCVSQDTSFLRGSLADYARLCGVEDHLFQALLRKLDFSRSQLEKPMEAYSEGQKKKVLIARSLCQQAHLYIWDEPLNFVDIYSRIQIENLILNYRPTMLLAEHDENFVRRIATKTIAVIRAGSDETSGSHPC